MSDIQEQLRKIEYVPPDAKDAPLGLYDKKELEALIQEQVRLARIEEINYVSGFGERGGHDVYCLTIGEAVIKRRNELKAGDE